MATGDEYRPFNGKAMNDWFYQLLSLVERLAVYRNERLFTLIDDLSYEARRTLPERSGLRIEKLTMTMPTHELRLWGS